jgi:hypothetical protein
MVTKSIKERLLRAKEILQEALHKLMEINRLKKQLPFLKDREKKEEELGVELKMLNKIVNQQAVLIRKYEDQLQDQD